MSQSCPPWSAPAALQSLAPVSSTRPGSPGHRRSATGAGLVRQRMAAVRDALVGEARQLRRRLAGGPRRQRPPRARRAARPAQQPRPARSSRARTSRRPVAELRRLLIDIAAPRAAHPRPRLRRRRARARRLGVGPAHSAGLGAARPLLRCPPRAARRGAGVADRNRLESGRWQRCQPRVRIPPPLPSTIAGGSTVSGGAASSTSDVALLDDVAGGDLDRAHGAGAPRRSPGSPSSSTPAGTTVSPAATRSPGPTTTLITLATISATISDHLLAGHAANLVDTAGRYGRSMPARAPAARPVTASDGAWVRPGSGRDGRRPPRLGEPAPARRRSAGGRSAGRSTRISTKPITRPTTTPYADREAASASEIGRGRRSAWATGAVAATPNAHTHQPWRRRARMWLPQARAGYAEHATRSGAGTRRGGRGSTHAVEQVVDQARRAVAPQQLGVRQGERRARRLPTSDRHHAAAAEAVQAGAEPEDHARRRQRATRPRVMYSKRARLTTGLEADGRHRADRGDQDRDDVLARRPEELHRRHRRHHREHRGDHAGHHGGAACAASRCRATSTTTPERQGQDRRRPAGRRCGRPAPRCTRVTTATAPAPASQARARPAPVAATRAASPPATTSSQSATPSRCEPLGGTAELGRTPRSAGRSPEAVAASHPGWPAHLPRPGGRGDGGSPTPATWRVARRRGAALDTTARLQCGGWPARGWYGGPRAHRRAVERRARSIAGSSPASTSTSPRGPRPSSGRCSAGRAGRRATT